MTRQPAAIFIVDILKEHIALAEAKRLNIPTFAIVDTNSNPKLVDFPIPANDDATKSIALILDEICNAIQQGLEDRKNMKGDSSDEGSEEVVVEAPVAEKKAAVKTPVAEAVEETPAVEETSTEEAPTEESSTEEA
jgi:small subunit ribosomal protein S2